MIVPREPQTAAAVAAHYDELDPFYREIWGEHVHHGLWTTGRETPGEAVEALVDLLADQLGLEPGERVCDVGCGYGATAERLAEAFGVQVTGLTISAQQMTRASERAARTPGLAFALRDWLDNGFEEGVFDAVIAIESSEHVADKGRFFAEAFRTLRPGGRLGVYAWLARTNARPWEVRHLLEPICREGRLPGMGTEADYVGLARAAGFTVTGVEDLSTRVSRTWTLCAGRVGRQLLVSPRYRRFLRDARARNRIFALTLIRLIAAYRTGAMRYCLLTAEKPARPAP